MSFSFFIHCLADIILVLYMFSVPGLFVLGLLGFKSESLADRILAAFTASLFYICLGVTILGFTGLYSQLALTALLVGPSLWLWKNKPSLASRLELPRMNLFDLCAAAMLIVYLALAFLESSTTPFYGWDAMITWDAWAAGWGARTNINGYLFGGYPPLLPILGSVLYKMAGTASSAIPIETFVFHGMHPLFGAFTFVAIWRLCALWKAPFWLASLALAGLPVMQQNLNLGTADMLLTCLITCFAVLFISRLQGGWDTAKPDSLLLAMVLYAAFNAKATGLLAIVLFLLVWLGSRLVGAKVSIRKPALALLLSIAGIGFYYAEQKYVELTVTVDQQNPYEQNFRMASVRASVQASSNQSMGGKGYWDRLGAVAALALEGGIAYQIVKCMAFACLLICLARPDARPVALFIYMYFFFWLGTASYDYRNLLPALPAACALAAYGARLASDRIMLFFPLSNYPILAGAAILFAAFCAPPVARAAYDMLPLLSRGPAGIGTRLDFMAMPQDERVKAFFPGYYRDLEFLRKTRLLDTQPNIIATSSFFRVAPKGIYPLKTFSWSIVRPGDVAAAHPAFPVGTVDAWTPLRSSDGLIAIYEPSPAPVPIAGILYGGSNAPKRVGGTDQEPEIEFSGPNSIVAVNLLNPLAGFDRKRLPDASLTFRIHYQQIGGTELVEPFLLSYSPTVISDAGTSIASKSTLTADASTIVQSGILTLALPPLSVRPEDGLLIGLRCQTTGQRIKLKKFAVTLYSANRMPTNLAVAAPGDTISATDAEARKEMEGLTTDGWMLKEGITIRHSHAGATFKRIVIVGEVPGEAGHLPVRIAVSLGANKLPSVLLTSPGVAELRIDLPTAKESIELKLIPDKGFVPKSLGINEDHRALCFRVTKVRFE